MFRRKPNITEVKLGRRYRFMYENFVVATQSATYLFLESSNSTIYGIKFDSSNVKYGGPNDEARGGHPLAKYGAFFYGLYEVANSPWIEEHRKINSVYPSHFDALFDGYRHFIAGFKDVMLEVMCRTYEEVALSQDELLDLVKDETGKLSE